MIPFPAQAAPGLQAWGGDIEQRLRQLETPQGPTPLWSCPLADLPDAGSHPNRAVEIAESGAIYVSVLVGGVWTWVNAGQQPVTTYPTFSAHRNGVDQTGVATSTATKVQLTTEAWDVGACYDNATNYRWTPNLAGKYQVNAVVNTSYAGTGTVLAMLYKNGSEHKRGDQVTMASGAAVSVTAIVEANGSTDYFELYVFQNSGGNATIAGGSPFTFFQGFHAAP